MQDTLCLDPLLHCIRPSARDWLKEALSEVRFRPDPSAALRRMHHEKVATHRHLEHKQKLLKAPPLRGQPCPGG